MNSDMMDAKRQIDPMEFACRFLKTRGAALELRGDVTNILLPKDVAQSLMVEEFITVGADHGASDGSDTRKIYPLQFQTPLLDRIASTAGATPPFLQANLKFAYIKTQGFDRLIKEQFELHKSKIKVIKTGETKTRYLLLTCRFRAQSDELKEGLLDICFNLDTGAVISNMAEAISLVQKEYPAISPRGCTKKEIEKIHELVSRYGPEMIEHKLSFFVESMNRRFKRDAASLDEYYAALEKEMAASLARGGISDRLILERKEKIAMVPDELTAKKKDLLNKYSITINFRPVAALALTSPCVTVFIKLMSGRKKSNITMTYNPVTKKMDPMVCRSCGMSTYVLGCCPNMHVNCLSCIEQGGQCGRTICCPGASFLLRSIY